MAEIRLKSTGTIKLFENDNTSSVTIASPASLGGDRTITLPDASVTLASGTMLATDGDGSGLSGVGKILQVQSAVLSAATTYNSDTFTDLTGLSQAITPAATTSTILCLASLSYGYDDSSLARIYFQIVRGTTSILITSGTLETGADTVHITTTNAVFLDSPNTTSATTYKIQGRSTNSALDIRIAGNSDSTQTSSTLTLIEVGA